MSFVLPLLCLGLVTLGTQGSELPSDLKATFEEINKKYNTHLEWNDALATKALDEANRPHSVAAYLKIRGDKHFSKKDDSTLADKVREALKNPFDRMGKRVHHLPERTIYGCNGNLDTNGADHIMSVACVYNNPKMRTLRV
ncbi:hypothetical protein V3C99_016707 [Haemonchus contortus]|uniref:SCP domain-containing protein n=1 Tax=Haemonchus contortus TaxID=6289 RepID=A0A7I5ED86_HAECO|nr:p15 [Haemonchus contortus]